MVDKEKIAGIKEAIKTKTPQQFKKYCEEQKIDYDSLKLFNTALSKRGLITKVIDFLKKMIGQPTSIDLILAELTDRDIQKAANNSLIPPVNNIRNIPSQLISAEIIFKNNKLLTKKIDTTSDAFQDLNQRQRNIIRAANRLLNTAEKNLNEKQKKILVNANQLVQENQLRIMIDSSIQQDKEVQKIKNNNVTKITKNKQRKPSRNTIPKNVRSIMGVSLMR